LLPVARSLTYMLQGTFDIYEFSICNSIHYVSKYETQHPSIEQISQSVSIRSFKITSKSNRILF
jgi:hypothetical protein